jgi:hypothetical protein
MTYSGTEYEDVYVNIDVDTSPFDTSVSGCNASVSHLTGAVVATEAAQLVAINRNAKKVAGTIVDGFFKNIRFGISTQIVELTKKIEANLMHLRELAKQLSAKKAQMEADYNRTSEHYAKNFDALNSELFSRINELDKPAFALKKETDRHSIRAQNSDLVNTVAVSGAEGGELQAKISASVAKSLAVETIQRASEFLLRQRKMENTVNRSMMSENTSAVHHFPVCFVEAHGDKGQMDRDIYQPDFLTREQADGLVDDFLSMQWSTSLADSREKIRRYLNIELSSGYGETDEHASRVRETIVKLIDLDSIKANSIIHHFNSKTE